MTPRHRFVPRRGGHRGEWAAALAIWLGLVTVAMAPAAAWRPKIPIDVRFESRYTSALRDFSESRDEAAAAKLADLHREVLERARRDPLAALEKRTGAIDRKLVRAEPAAALAIAALFEQAYARQMRLSDYRLASFSRETAASRLRAAGLDAGPADRAAVASQMAGLAARTHEARQWTAAAVLYRAAVGLDPSVGAAWLGLAAIQEKRGAHASAVESLEALERYAGGPAESRLRLGVNLLRVGRLDEGRSLLGELAENPAVPGWMRSIAAQEVARSLLAAGDTAAARTVVERTATQLPCDPSLEVLREYVAERHLPATGRASLALGELCPAPGPSSRAVYNRPPSGGVPASAVRLEEARRALGEALLARGYLR